MFWHFRWRSAEHIRNDEICHGRAVIVIQPKNAMRYSRQYSDVICKSPQLTNKKRKKRQTVESYINIPTKSYMKPPARMTPCTTPRICTPMWNIVYGKNSLSHYSYRSYHLKMKLKQRITTGCLVLFEQLKQTTSIASVFKRHRSVCVCVTSFRLSDIRASFIAWCLISLVLEISMHR